MGITNVHFDSREIKANGLFVPLASESGDGHKFIVNAINNGAVATLWKSTIDIPEELKDKITFFEVTDTLVAFQELAATYIEKVNPIVIGVTGSNGKTTTKEFLFSVLSEKYKCHKNVGNFNNHIGVPMTALNMPIDTEVCILEMGMNHASEIELLSNLSKPDYAIITNIGESHIGHFKSREGIAEAKKEILSGLKDKTNILYDGDESLLENLEGEGIFDDNFRSINTNSQGITFGYNGVTFKINTLGEHNVKNAAYAIKLAQKLSLTNSQIQTGLFKFKNAPMRLEPRKVNDIDFLIDCYNASLTSVTSAIKTFKSIDTDKEKLIILGDVLELGGESRNIHREIGKAIKNANLPCWFVGEEMEEAYKIAKEDKIRYFEDTNEVIANLALLPEKGYVLLKGSRGMKLERIYNSLESKNT